jgi:hypothetical protein
MLLGGIGVCLFFVLFFFIVRYVANPQLLYHADKLPLPSGKVVEFPIFRMTPAFFDEFLSRPGGLSEYVAAGLSQYYYYSFLGPLVVTGVALMLYLLTGGIIRFGEVRGSWPIRFVPPLLWLLACCGYQAVLCNYLAIVVALAGLGAYRYLAGRFGGAISTLLSFSILSACTYYLAGGAYMLFAILCALFELLEQKRRVLGALYAVSAVLVPLGGVGLFAISLNEAYFGASGLAPFDGSLGVVVLCGLYVFLIIMALAARYLRVLGDSVLSVLGGVAVLMAMLAGVMLTVDKDATRILQANYLARMERWDELLENVEDNGSEEYPASVMMDINRALFETGQMGASMFAHRQHPSLLFELGKHAVRYKGGCDVLLALGRINEAEHASLEDLEINGPRPETLRRLAIIYIVKDHPEAARVFLTMLSKDIVAGDWAAGTLVSLDKDPQMKSNEEINRLRSIMPLCDMIVTTPKSADVNSGSVNPKETLLPSLLVRNRKNRMAFEYLMAYYLLTKQPGKVACTINRLDDFNYPTVPDHYAEAIIMYSHYKLRRPAKLPGIVITSRAREKVRGVISLANGSKGDNESLVEALAKEFPGSYCVYLLDEKLGGAK